MNEKKDAESESSRTNDLHHEAARRLRDNAAAQRPSRSEADVRALLHELQVHQIELEMQHQELMCAQEKLQEVSDKYHDLFDFAPIGYFLLNEQGRILEVNLAGAAILGLDRSASANQQLEKFVTPRCRTQWSEFFLRVLSAEGKQTCATEFSRGDGRVDILLEGILSHDARGNSLIHLVATDITEQKRVNEQLQEAKETAETASRAKDRFLALLSHELRTPLTPIVLGVSIALENPHVDPGLRQLLETIRRNAEMESMLIDDLLDMTRIVSGKLVIRRESVELGAIIQDAVAVCQPDIEARGMELCVDMGAAGAYWVDADHHRLQQVFGNLLRNATKFTPDGGRIRIRCRSDKQDQVIAEVIDSGIGMDPCALPNLFHAFEQLDHSITRQYGGVGLGLTISKVIVEMHGGEIEAHSDGLNKGATFRLRLPMIAPGLQPPIPSSALTPPHATPPLRILLVEDHPVTAQMLQMAMTERGHFVETAADAATGLDLASRHCFDLLISDLGLPDGSGHDLMREFRTRGNTFVGIALSGYGQSEDIRRSQEAGFTAHLTKPVSCQTLVATITALMAEKTSQCRIDPGSQRWAEPANDAGASDLDEASRHRFGRK